MIPILTDKLTAKIYIPFVSLLGGLATTGITIVVYSWHCDWAPSVDNIVKIAATGVGATTALYAALNFSRLSAAHEETIVLKKQEMTAKFIERWLDPKFGEVAKELSPFLKEAPTLTAAELANRVDNDLPLRSNAMLVLNVLEALAVQLKHNALDERLAKDYFRGIVKTYHSRLSGLIALGRTRLENPRLHQELEELAARWSQE